MPIIFQKIWHLFLELFCAKAALKVPYVYHSRIVTSMADGRPDLQCLSLRDDAETHGLMAQNVIDDTPAMIHQSPNPTLLLH
jgi:hypothetical protein